VEIFGQPWCVEDIDYTGIESSPRLQMLEAVSGKNRSLTYLAGRV